MARRKRTQLHGARELERVLKLLPKQIRGAVLQRSVMAGATPIRKAAKANAPRASGALANSIVARKDKTAGASAAVKIGPTRKRFYGLFAEFGTSTQPAKPWLRPAFETTKGEALNRIGKALGRNIEKAAIRLAGSFAKSGLARKGRRR